jgi:hypothetical protein
MKKIITLALISSLFIASIPADDFVSMLKQKLEEFNKNNSADRAILVFNQKKYAVADTAFFQTYLFNEEMIGVKGKKILSLTIYDTNGKAIQRINFSVTNGKANNQLAISPATPPGVYLFSVNYAQNSDDESGILFAKEIAIVEKNTIALAAPSTAPQLSVSYESGFVNSIENTLILQCNQSGSGKIKNSKNEEIVSFTLVKNKISTLSFIPQKGETYYAEMESLGIKTPLAAAKNDGYVIRLAESMNAPTRKITILSSFNESQKNEIYLVVTNRRKITFSTPVFFDSKGFFEANLPKDVTKNGISFATLFDEKGNVLAERPFFKQEPSLVASLTPTAIDAGTRKKVSLELTLKDLFGNALQGDFSVSAFQKDLFKEELANSFSNEVTLPYPISLQLAMQPMAGETNQERNNQTDYLIASDQSIAMPWSSILNSVSKPSKVVSSSLKLKGKIIFKESGKPVPDSTLIMGYLQNNMIGYVGYTSKDGRFELPFLYDFFGDDQLFYLLEQNGKEMTEPFQMIPDEGKLSVRPTNRYIIKDSIDQYAEYILKKRIVEKSYNFYAPKNVMQSEIDDLNARFEEEAMGVDMSVNVQDYISFPTMEDLVREVIPFLQNKKKGTVSSVRLLINQNKRNTNYVTAKGEPLFIIDGILTKNIQSFLNLKPVDILTIKIINDINKLNRLGPLGKNGVVLIKTKKPAESNIINNSTIINVQGLNKPKEYYNPTYSSANNATIPDIRSFLYWNPIQSLSQSGKATIEFYTSDKVGSYTISVKGISTTGEPFEISTNLNVSFQQHP